MAGVEEVEVVVAHNERATLRVGDVFVKIDADQTRTDVATGLSGATARLTASAAGGLAPDPAVGDGHDRGYSARTAMPG